LVIINRLQIGDTCHTHSYLLSGADQPECMPCQCPLTVKQSSLNMLITTIQQTFRCFLYFGII